MMRTTNSVMILVLYVNDLLITSSSASAIYLVKDIFHDRFSMLASEVTPGLQQEQSPTPISLCHDLFNGVIGWRLTQTMWF
jgi:hypothetical protein